MSTAVAPAQPDTRDMVIVHRVFRRECRLMPDLIRAVPAGDVARAAILADHCASIMDALHHHHEGEDELLWPKLLDRDAADAPLIERMEAQHRALVGPLAQIGRLLPAWRAGADPDLGAELADAVAGLSPLLDEHLEDEESNVLPIARTYLSVGEWDEIGERGAASIPKSKLLVFLGAILEDASDEEQRAFLAKLPLQARVLWPLFGRRAYGRYIGKVRGTA